VDLSCPSPNALIGGNVEATVVSLDEAHPTLRPGVADAREVDGLVPLDGFPAALVLPAT
jgi:hypothetical protein